jgi:hypothetical protein
MRNASFEFKSRLKLMNFLNYKNVFYPHPIPAITLVLLGLGSDSALSSTYCVSAGIAGN